MGFRTIESVSTISAFDTTVNKQAYYILAFWKRLLSMVTSPKSRIVKIKTIRVVNTKYGSVIGAVKAIYGDAIAVAVDF